MMVSGHIEATALNLIVICFCRDSEFGKMLMACGKLSNHAPSAQNRLNGACYGDA